MTRDIEPKHQRITMPVADRAWLIDHPTTHAQPPSRHPTAAVTCLAQPHQQCLSPLMPACRFTRSCPMRHPASAAYATPSRIRQGRPFPRGAIFDGKGTNFALFSAHATRVELCLFDEQGNESRVDLPEYTNEIWHGYLPDVKPGQRYGYRVHGPYAPTEGHRFNHNTVSYTHLTLPTICSV